jgi:hypothetical protein
VWPYHAAGLAGLCPAQCPVAVRLGPATPVLRRLAELSSDQHFQCKWDHCSVQGNAKPPRNNVQHRGWLGIGLRVACFLWLLSR